jgi:hypothetical protein
MAARSTAGSSPIVSAIACRRMKRDRFIADASEHEQDVSAEVYLVVTDEGRRAARVGWRYLAVAIAILAGVAAIVVSSLPSGGRRSSASAIARPRTAQSTRVSSAVAASASSCVAAPGYGGLGGRLNTFDANNSNSVGQAGPSPGNAFYMVTGAARGCVTAFAVQDSTSPPLTARDLLVLVSRPYLPDDAKQVVSTDSCAVWKSASLKRATGRAYAQATAIAQAGSTAGRAEIEATSSPSC